MEGDDGAAVEAGEGGVGLGGGFMTLAHVGRQGALAGDIDGQADQHADAAGGEAVVPVRRAAAEMGGAAANDRGDQGAQVNADVENGVGAVDALVAGAVEAADLGGDVGLEEAVAGNEHDQADEEQAGVYQHEFAGGHDGRAQDDGAALAE